MNRYKVSIFPQAYRELDYIFAYIKNEFKSIDTAASIFLSLEEAILSLSEMPQRGAERKSGAYAYRGHRQLFVKNYTIIYRIDEEIKEVLIVTIRYAHIKF